MITSKKNADHFLGDRFSVQRIEKLLVEWANTKADYPVAIDRPFSREDRNWISKTDAAILRLKNRYPEVFTLQITEGPGEADSKIPYDLWKLVAWTQRFLRLAWDHQDLRSREWYIFKARDRYQYETVQAPLSEARIREYFSKSPVEQKKASMTEITPAEDFARTHPPALSPFEKAMFHFQRIVSRALHCKNPECPAPYFLKEKKGQLYCSCKCAAPAQREQKRLWWEQNRGKKVRKDNGL